MTSLRLCNRGLGDKKIKDLAEALASTTTLTQLDLRGNCLGIESGRAIAEALKVNPQLTSVLVDAQGYLNLCCVRTLEHDIRKRLHS